LRPIALVCASGTDSTNASSARPIFDRRIARSVIVRPDCGPLDRAPDAATVEGIITEHRLVESLEAALDLFG
jgi:hypothetical protein